jgi:hypothetical protein
VAMCFSLAACGGVPVTILDPGCTAKVRIAPIKLLSRPLSRPHLGPYLAPRMHGQGKHAPCAHIAPPSSPCRAMSGPLSSPFEPFRDPDKESLVNESWAPDASCDPCLRDPPTLARILSRQPSSHAFSFFSCGFRPSRTTSTSSRPSRNGRATHQLS